MLELIERHVRKEAIPLLPGDDGHNWGGRLYVDEIEVCDKASKFHKVSQLEENCKPLQGGWRASDSSA